MSDRPRTMAGRALLTQHDHICGCWRGDYDLLDTVLAIEREALAAMPDYTIVRKDELERLRAALRALAVFDD